MTKIKPTKLYEKIEQGSEENSVIIDVRSEQEHSMSHIQGAQHIPLSDIEQSKNELEEYDKVYVHCNSGNKSGQACKRLKSIGLNNVVSVEGGLQEWEKLKLPTEGEVSHGISLTRQVMIAAGSLILIGFVGAYTISQWFLALSAFVGAGLLFAGVSGYCMMARILSNMPWNK